VRVSVVIPAHNEAATLARTITAVRAQRRADVELQIIVVDDASADDTTAVAQRAGAVVVRGSGGNPGAARNRGAAAATGDVIIFLDADCVPAAGWLDALLAAHATGAAVVGGALALPAGLPYTARADYYGTSYHMHPQRAPGRVPNHTPANLSVSRATFAATRGFIEEGPAANGHEELAWQAQLARQGAHIQFAPQAVVYHYNRAGIGNLLRRNYRWAYSSIESKATYPTVRFPWLYRWPRLLALASAPLAIAQFAYILGCWLRAGIREPLLMMPLLLLGRAAYAAGMGAGALHWLRSSRRR
jgi:glycosyltransferase involved in cell wall biosynthesis